MRKLAPELVKVAASGAQPAGAAVGQRAGRQRDGAGVADLGVAGLGQRAVDVDAARSVLEVLVSAPDVVSVAPVEIVIVPPLYWSAPVTVSVPAVTLKAPKPVSAARRPPTVWACCRRSSRAADLARSCGR